MNRIHKRKTALILLCAALLLPAAACSGGEPADSPAASSSVASRQETTPDASSSPESREESRSESTKDASAASDLSSAEESSRPESEKAESGSSESGKPESSTPATSKPATGTPETSKPESGKPETSKPESSKPESSKPEYSKPESSKPESSKPESSTPESSKPETSKPETNAYDVQMGDDISKFAGTSDGKAPYNYQNSRTARALAPMEKSGKMHMKGTISAAGFPMTVEMYSHNDKSYVKAQMLGRTMAEVIVPGDGNAYMYSMQTPDTYTVYSADDSSLGSLGMDMPSSSMEDATITESGTIRLNGKTYYYEKMETEKGATIAYLDGDKLVRVDIFSAQTAGGTLKKQGMMDTIDDKVDDSLFVLNPDYTLQPHES